MISSFLCNLSENDVWYIWANVVKKQVYIIFFWLPLDRYQGLQDARE